MKGGNECGRDREEACWARQRRAEMESFKTKAMARCDKHRLKSPSRSDSAGTVKCEPLLTPQWRRTQNKKTELKPLIFESLLEGGRMRIVSGPQQGRTAEKHTFPLFKPGKKSNYSVIASSLTKSSHFGCDTDIITLPLPPSGTNLSLGFTKLPCHVIRVEAAPTVSSPPPDILFSTGVN